MSLVAIAACLAAGIVLGSTFAVKAGSEPNTPAVGCILVVFSGLFYYGPVMVGVGWRMSVPLIATLGFVLAYVWRRPRSAAAHFAAQWIVGIVAVVLVGYGLLLSLIWAFLLMRPI
jgi:hypothetical protein